MQRPSAHVIYLFIACVIAVTLIFFGAQSKKETPLNLAVVSNTASSTNDASGPSESDITNAALQTGNSTSSSESTPEDNLTSSLSKKLFSKYAAVSQDGTIDTTNSQNIISDVLNSANSIDFGSDPHYTYKDLTLIKTSEVSTRTFANTFITTENTCLAEVTTVSQSTQDPKKVGTLYRGCAARLIGIAIPQEIAESYLNLMNMYYLLSDRLILLADADQDPVKQLLILKDIGTLNNMRQSLYTPIASFIKNSGIIFKKDEPGYIFNPTQN